MKKPHVEHFEFKLSKRYAEQLGKNIEKAQEELKNLVLYSGVPHIYSPITGYPISA